MRERELPRVRHPRPEMRQELIDVRGFIADAGEIGVAGQPRFAPMLNGDSADEAETPIARPTKALWISSAASSSRLLPATLMATCEDALHFDQAGAKLGTFVNVQHPAELQHVEGRLSGLQR